MAGHVEMNGCRWDFQLRDSYTNHFNTASNIKRLHLKHDFYLIFAEKLDSKVIGFSKVVNGK